MSIVAKDFPITLTNKIRFTKDNFKCPEIYGTNDKFKKVTFRNGVSVLHTTEVVPDNLCDDKYFSALEQLTLGIQSHEEGYDRVIQQNNDKGTIIVFLKTD